MQWKKTEEKLRDPSHYLKKRNIRIIGITKGEKRDMGTERIFKQTMMENFLYLKKEMKIDIQETRRTSNYFNERKITARHIIIKLPRVQDKERIMKLIRERKHVSNKGKQISMISDFSEEMIQARRD